MDPWADEGPAYEAGPSSWNASTAVAVAVSPIPSPSRLRSDAGPADPWAEGSGTDVTLPTSDPLPRSPVVDILASNPYGDTPADDANDHDRVGSGSLGNTFDPWGGGSAPIAPLSSHSAGRDTEQAEQPAQLTPWQHDDTNEHASAGADDEEDPAGTNTAQLDEDDPWGSGAQARRIKEEQAARELAQRMEIVRLQEEAKGKSFDEGGREEQTEGSGRPSQEVKEEAKQDDTAAPAAAPGWRSLFSRATTRAGPEAVKTTVESKMSADEQQKSADAADAPRSSLNITAPRLWQAPSLRTTGHARTTSNTSLGSATASTSDPHPANAAGTNAASASGPGWQVAPKKQASGSGGFMQNFLGVKDGGQTASSSTASALSRFGQSLQRPPIISAEDQDPEDDSIDDDDTGIEWEAGNAFDAAKSSTKQQPRDLLDSDDQPPAQGSAVTRILGRWRSKPEESKKKGGISGDDLSWLENIGDGHVQRDQAKADNDEDWLAFVQSSNDGGSSGEQQRGPQLKATQSPFAASGAKISIPYAGRPQTVKPPIAAGPLQPPPRFTAASQKQHQNTLLGASPDPADDFSFGSQDDSAQLASSVYRDEPDSHDDTLLRQQERQRVAGSLTAMPGQQMPRHKPGAGGLLAGLTGRPVRAYTFDDDDDEGRGDDDGADHGWSAFKDTPVYSDASVSRLQPSKTAPTNGVRHGNTVHRQPASPQSSQATRPLSAVLARPPSRTSTPGSLSSGGGGGTLPLPPPPSTHRVQPPQVSAPVLKSSTPTPSVPPATKALSQGTTLTNDDLSFFETL